MIVRWPNKIKAGTVCDTPVISNDFYPTMLDLAGVDMPDYTVDDGISLEPLLTGSGTLEREAVYFHFPHYNPVGAYPYSAVRKGDYKLIHYYEDGSDELFNLIDDIGETNNLAASMPDKTAELKTMLDTWLDHVDAQVPEPNPAYEGGESPGEWILAE